MSNNYGLRREAKIISEEKKLEEKLTFCLEGQHFTEELIKSRCGFKCLGTNGIMNDSKRIRREKGKTSVHIPLRENLQSLRGYKDLM